MVDLTITTIQPPLKVTDNGDGSYSLSVEDVNSDSILTSIGDVETAVTTNRPDWLIDVAKGNVPGHSLVHKFGRNAAIPSGSWEVLSLLSGARNFLSAPAALRIKAGGNSADTAAGSGAQEVTVQGIDSTLQMVTVTIATNGTSASTATTETFWRPYRAWVSKVGTYGGGCAADITIETTGGTAMLVIKNDEDQTQFGGYSIAENETGYLLSAHVTIDSVQAADIRCMVREAFTTVAAPMRAPQLKLHWDGLDRPFPYLPKAPEFSVPELSDIWFEGRGAGGSTEASIDFELLIVQDGF